MTETFTSKAEVQISLLRMAIAENPNSHALLYKLAYALADAGAYDEFATVFQRAFRLHPSMMSPSPDNWSAKIGTQEIQRLRDNARALVDRGVIYSPVLAALAIGEAILGNRTAAARLVDCDRFLRCIPSLTPKDFAVGDFFEALTAEIKSNLKHYHQPQGGVMRNAWRHNHFMSSATPACRALEKEIRCQVERYVADLPAGMDHPFLLSRPAEYMIDGWAMVTSGEGHLAPHIHPRAWMNGVYYVARPTHSQTSGSASLRVGPPDGLGITPADGWPERVIEPEPGSLVLMPGYFFHATQPTNVDEERICVAFNICPIEFGRSSP
jgi:hypothetical protein